MGRTLSADVRLLGDTLGEVIRAHGGGALFDRVETMRQAAKRAREDCGPPCDAARAELERQARESDPETALEVVRAFTLYFELVNQAEDVHRARALRRREIESGPEGVPESLAAAVAELAGRGATREEVLSLLGEVTLTFVFTAHPTEPRRRTTERLLSRVRECLEQLDRFEQTAREEAASLRHLRASIEALWDHAPQRRVQPTVLDEAKMGLFYLERVVLHVLPDVHRRLCEALERHFGPVEPRELPVPVRFGSWMGSDRDGHPFVDDAVTEEVLRVQREIVLDGYVAELDRLIDPFAAAERRLPPDERLDAALARAAAAVPEAVPEVDARNADEPLRRLASFMRERLRRARRFEEGAYTGPDELLADLEVAQDVLRRVHADAVAGDQLADLITRVRSFGFHLAPLDVREDGRVHRRVVAELLGDPDYPERPPSERIERLQSLSLRGVRSAPSRERVAGPRDAARRSTSADVTAVVAGLSAEAHRLLSLFESLASFQQRFGAGAIGTYVISRCSSPADVVEILHLARLHGIADRLDIVPLLEDYTTLARAGELADELFRVEEYRKHLARRGDVQEVMVGYSDSMKESGMLASRVCIREAQRALARACCEHGLLLRVFHGRGGSVSRGGGPSHRAIRALPADAFSGRLKLTEQGETRAFHFGKPAIAERYLEETLGATLLRRHEARTLAFEEPERVSRELEALAEPGRAAYQRLAADPALLRFFECATPFEVIARLQIGSRPAGREGDGLSLDRLRAIPWVFAWSQARILLTGWYGVGTAFAEADRAGLHRLYRSSPFFRDLVDNVEMTLAKTDLAIARRYADLCSDGGLRARIFEPIAAELERTRSAVLDLTGESELLEHDPVLHDSIRLRNPYVDPLSYVQVEALRHQRSGRDPEAWARVARVSVQGIAAGLRNTG